MALEKNCSKQYDWNTKKRGGDKVEKSKFLFFGESKFK